MTEYDTEYDTVNDTVNDEITPVDDGINSDGEERNKIEAGMLYVVATPIGNLSDISARALKVLRDVTFIAAEDTRVTAKLLTRYGLNKSLVSYHEHNKTKIGESIIRRLKEGESCAVVTDAGTPAVSDPGSDLVSDCIKANIPVTSVPGACAAINALVLSGFDTRRFCFEGFLPEKGKEKKERLSELALEERTMIFYASPHDLTRYLSDFSEYFGDRPIALCREMTKLNEEIIRTTVNEAVRAYSDESRPKGEFVLIVQGKQKNTDMFWENMTVSEHVDFYIEKGLAKMDAIKKVAADRRVPKNEIYKQLI